MISYISVRSNLWDIQLNTVIADYSTITHLSAIVTCGKFGWMLMTDINRLFLEHWYQPVFILISPVKWRSPDWRRDFHKDKLYLESFASTDSSRLFLGIIDALWIIKFIKRVIKRLSGTSLIRVWRDETTFLFCQLRFKSNELKKIKL